IWVRKSSLTIELPGGGAETAASAGVNEGTQAGYAIVTPNSGTPPYATAIFSLSQNGVVVSEAAVPASPPTQSARIFIDYQTGVPAGVGALDIYTGLAIAH